MELHSHIKGSFQEPCYGFLADMLTKPTSKTVELFSRHGHGSGVAHFTSGGEKSYVPNSYAIAKYVGGASKTRGGASKSCIFLPINNVILSSSSSLSGACLQL